MKLVEILAKKLDVWPTGAAIAVQDGDALKTVKFGSKHANPSIALMGVKDVWQARDWKYTYQSDFDHSVLASDWKTAIVTKKQWQAERDRQKGGEWKRHRGGKQPVANEILVEFKFRSGVTGACYASDLLWDHQKQDDDVMQYRIISQPQAEEVEVKDTTIGTLSYKVEIDTSAATQAIDEMAAKWDQIETPFKWRDEVTELNAYIEKFTRERDSLIERLASEGFALIPAMTPVMGVADIDFSDWRNWKAGDIIEMTADDWCDLSRYAEYDVKSVSEEGFVIVDDLGDKRYLEYDGETVFKDGRVPDFKFIRRP